MYQHGVFWFCKFWYLDWIQIFTINNSSFSIFSPNTVKYRTEKLWICWTFFHDTSENERNKGFLVLKLSHRREHLTRASLLLLLLVTQKDFDFKRSIPSTLWSLSSERSTKSGEIKTSSSASVLANKRQRKILNFCCFFSTLHFYFHVTKEKFSGRFLWIFAFYFRKNLIVTETLGPSQGLSRGLGNSQHLFIHLFNLYL